MSFAAPLMLIAARARRRPGRWLLTAAGVALATAFAVAVVAQGTIAGDQAARAALSGLSPLDRAVQVTYYGTASPSVERTGRRVITGLGLATPTSAVLINPVRLSTIIVRPVAIDPLRPWLSSSTVAPESIGACRPSSCPMLAVAGGRLPRALVAPGIRLVNIGTAVLNSAAPLGYAPVAGEFPVLVTGDAAGLGSLPGLTGLAHTTSWLGLLQTAPLNSWQLAAIERRLQRAQAKLISTNGDDFTFSGPFGALDAARAQARAAPQRLLLAGGGALAALAVFIVLAAGALRRDQLADVTRLRAAGARSSQCLAFVIGEAATLCAVALLAGAAVGLAVAALLASAGGVPVGGVLTHSVVTAPGLIALLAGWLCATALLAVVLAAQDARIVDVLALAAVAVVVTALATAPRGNGSVAVLLAPLCCLAAGVVIFRLAAGALRGAERVARPGPVLGRLAFVGLARSPGPPSLAIAFVAITVGLGGFALAYRATLLRGTADEAANQVPLDATVSPASNFTTPLELASLARWQALSGGEVLPVRRTLGTYTSGTGAVTEPALGVPARALTQIHGWRASDGTAPLATLARRLIPPGPVRNPGPILRQGARSLSLRIGPSAITVTVTADLRSDSGLVRQLPLGQSGSTTLTLHAKLPPGRWELEALELDESAGLQATFGHQLAENPAAATQFSSPIALGPLQALSAAGRPIIVAPLRSWVSLGAAARPPTATRPDPDTAMILFSTTGEPGIVRPVQPSDTRPVPVLVDPQTAAAAATDGRIAFTIDELPVAARVVGVLKRFPTVGAGAAGLIVADEATLASALDAQLPGQGLANELWISTAQPRLLGEALSKPPFSQLGSAFRGQIQRQLRSAPAARGVLGTLLAATALAGVLAIVGLLVALLGSIRDREIDEDLTAQGFGPRELRRQLRLRLLITAAGGVVAGLAIAVLLTRLAVAAVRAAGSVAVPQPPLVTIAPWGELVLWAMVAMTLLALAAVAMTRWRVR